MEEEISASMVTQRHLIGVTVKMAFHGASRFDGQVFVTAAVTPQAKNITSAGTQGIINSELQKGPLTAGAFTMRAGTMAQRAFWACSVVSLRCGFRGFGIRRVVSFAQILVRSRISGILFREVVQCEIQNNSLKASVRENCVDSNSSDVNNKFKLEIPVLPDINTGSWVGSHP